MIKNKKQSNAVPPATKAPVAKAKAAAKNERTHAAPTAKTGSKAETKAKPASAASRPTARKNSKTEKILALLKRPGGTTIEAIMKATDWQAHSVRAFLSATVAKRKGFKVRSDVNARNERVYSITR